MSTINIETPAIAIEWPWGQALKLGGTVLWNTVKHELTGQMALLIHLTIEPSSKADMLETIDFLRDIANQHIYS